ncbi:class I SAM-dependent methyltransferase [Nocardioides mesophilus]|uniref:Class I SAM-dependent methyltransferase n=1 Tax=Nocardioides mesophilus TaxID=433659 RepID=A0A7G9R6D3_9ACTN|nr:class I SAM-dependent methyltransferase [Nocardioides mesophilus]QNN51158.1 class I SAM-dependent methyltransferase [Nocardioides mesophilus]
MTNLNLNRALVFGEVAEEYARWRPTYPDEAVDWLARDATTIVDLGAGTGQLTGALLGRGATVHAVDRDPRMLRVLRTQFPAAHRHESGADQIPLPDHSVDAVLSADAWHWFPRQATIAEVRRVLRPGGWLGLVWNKVTPIQPWEYDLAGVDPDGKGLQEDTSSGRVDEDPFPRDETEVEAFPWGWSVTPEHFCDYLATNSAVIRLDDEARRTKLEDSRAIMARACAELGTSTARLHHEAYCVRWVPGTR